MLQFGPPAKEVFVGHNVVERLQTKRERSKYFITVLKSRKKRVLHECSYKRTIEAVTVVAMS